MTLEKASYEQQVENLIAEAEALLSSYKQQWKGLSWREKVLLLVDLNIPISDLGVYSNYRVANLAARERLRLYFIEHVGEIIHKEELRVVSGISEFGRRVRELRVEDGYKIITGVGDSGEFLGLTPEEYKLLDKEPDLNAAHRWHIANRIKRETKGGSQAKILCFLKEFVGKVVTNDELYNVSGAKEFGRRVRELRTEEGYAISTKFTGRPDLRVGEYVLESLNRVADPHDRKIPYEVQKQVYERDNNTCRLCGWNHHKWTKQDPRILELHHIREHAKGGQNSLDNVILLCSKCHDKVHAKKLSVPDNILD
ncbi:HNH endonuclease [Limihaloglobus sulfuriphilus]|uniref:HNH endonuclease n=1 Tax=Limihaloglobus sulfuriphilus TaxID=1851148 RepID=A0A1Q2MIL9_9BACT|nr:HNH endonuclease [Limihaloglobus sulfuriphilus]AQQ72102.1 HNH endonuclease [Limihaloglobus sulfuriphilus]